ncbi:ATP-binding protein [Neobacillus sp. PS3-34]|uniref:ATP-binding protein n=1 Tax=Neobacillus sp. PS3-34 TaxID=3070678 RepID=UPI0027E0AF0B|nr:ATP-binding protein [Neobacillus sp. PS3-34]WML50711.1 ATP-binding protein [Neobacillus sp. PS3-34]
MENLAAGIAHEIRNPLTTVKGFIQLIRPYLQEIDKVQYADIALEEIDRANGIIFEFLNASKPQMATQLIRSINALVKDIALLYESEAILRDIQIRSFLSLEDITIRMDANQLKQVLINIIKNSIEALDDVQQPQNERKIDLITEINQEVALIVIKDNGCGMTQETLDKLFLPFYTTKEKGTGIGLSVCKKIVEDSGGMIQVESAPGAGTIFRLSFPSTMFIENAVRLNY